jgi:hypothetical protein
MVSLDLKGIVTIALTGFRAQPLGYEVPLCLYGLLGKPDSISLYAVLVVGYLDIPVRGGHMGLVIRGLCVH